MPTQIQLINTLNDAIVTTEQHEIYLKDMNSTLLKVMEGARDNLTVMEKNKIHDLAHSCPAQNGLAVFKARQLNTLYEPLTTYNDYVICAPANKGGKGLYDDLFSFLNGTENINTNALEDKLAQQQVTLYPVPSSDVISIKFTIPNNKEAVLFIYDCTGKMLMQKTINEGQLNAIDISYLVNGLYTYRFSNDFENYTGKFNIIR